MRTAALLIAIVAFAPVVRADLRVIDSLDAVQLHDGTVVRGNVIAVGIKAVVIIVDDKEQIIPRERVMKITRGEVGRDVKQYATEVVEGMKRITGQGTSDDATAVAEAPTPPAAAAARPPGPGGSGPTFTREQLLQAMKSNPTLAAIIKGQGGPDKALEWLEQNRSNPAVMRQLEAFMKPGARPGGSAPPKR